MNSAEKYFMNGYILAGGKSSRMGMDKGLMILNGKPIVQHVIEQLQTVVTKVVIVSNNPDYKKFGFEVISDLIKDIGPAGGICTALKHSDSQQNFIVSCDMPFINSNAIKFIIENSNQSQITVPVLHNKLQPLFGVYSKSCLPKWKELIEKGVIKLQDLVAHFNLLKLNVDGSKIINELLFMNINTKEDFENAIKQV